MGDNSCKFFFSQAYDFFKPAKSGNHPGSLHGTLIGIAAEHLLEQSDTVTVSTSTDHRKFEHLANRDTHTRID